ncbi:hypothetical protein [Brevundimonas sp.]|uniref:hypothetical protein n=1 Tax=Brevundimonas sp. TaxID=1871086 RepID=UPI002ED7B217
MDPYGNLTTSAELAGGRRIRLISYLDPDVALGCFDSSDGAGWPRLGVHRLSSGDPDRTVFQTGRQPHFSEGDFYMIWTDEAGCVVSMEGDSDGCLTCIPITGGDDGDPPDYPGFTADFVNGCWFALNDSLGIQVVDISESGTGEQNPVIAFKWNGGPNQIWRAQDVDFTPPAVSDDEVMQQTQSTAGPGRVSRAAAA